VFIEATPLLAGASIPETLKDQCLAQGMLAEGNAAGHLNPNNLYGLPSGPFLQVSGWRPKGIGAMFGYVTYFIFCDLLRNC
jgi:iron transport multicopper oxidase